MPDIGLERARCRADAGSVSDTSLCSSAVMATCGWFAEGVAQRQRAMRGQFGDEAIGQRLDAVFFFLLGWAGWPPMVMTAR